jgi:hypothetical protein
MRRPLIALLFVCSFAAAQQRPAPSAGRDLAPPRDTSSAMLPTIDLPEFVITGRSSIELPKVEKRLEDGDPTGEITVAPASPVRDRVTGPGPGSSAVARPSTPQVEGVQGHLRAGMGSFWMPQIAASVRPILSGASVGVNGHYRRSSGFAPWTAWSEGGGDVTASLPIDLTSGGFQSAALAGDLGYESRSYRWFGTPSPADRRTVSILDGGVGARGWLGNWSGALSLRFGSTAIDDTSSSVTEALTRVAAEVDGEVGQIPVVASMSVLNASRSITGSASAGVATMAVGSRWQPIPTVRISGGLGMAFLHGDGGQKRGMLLPTIRVEFAIDERHRLSGVFEPRPEGITLMSSQAHHRFLDAHAPLRQTAWTNSGRFGLESDWTSDLRTRIEVEAGSARDLAMITDTAGRGVAEWMYGDASFAAVRAECIAKMRGNDYFSATVIVRSSRNSASGLIIPYWPVFESRVSYTAMVTPELIVRSSLQIVGARESQWSGASSRLPGYALVDVAGTYAILPGLSLWAEATNLSNSVYQHWKGIQEPPFRVSAGIALAW